MSSSARTASKSKLFTNPETPTSSNSKISSKLSSIFTNQVSDTPTPTSSNPTTSPKIPLEKFLHTSCKSGNITLNEALHYFDHMIHMQTPPPMSSFNRLLGGVVKRLCMVKRVDEATRLFGKMTKFRCQPSMITYGTLITGLCRMGKTDVALKLHEEMPSGNGVDCKPNTVTFTSLIQGLCAEDRIDEATRTGKTDVALRLHEEMANENGGYGVDFNEKTCDLCSNRTLAKQATVQHNGDDDAGGKCLRAV
ncbi:hypothetical protein M0R45_010709 [Rubus argutus]|uniref:Pentatricopeptide repeat-containing protein n=1 Tax=Rubus argutus TaxID=59490 RepID=A0AAW1Y7R9_RUBAR